MYALVVHYHYCSIRRFLCHMLRACWHTCSRMQLRLLPPRNYALQLEWVYQWIYQIAKKLCCYSENKTKIVFSLSLTAIEHFHKELRQTNICGVTRKLFVGIIQARCSRCLLDHNFGILCRSLFAFACFDRKTSGFLGQALHNHV